MVIGKIPISSYSFRGKYSFLNLEIQRSQYIRQKVTVHKGAETIWENTVYEILTSPKIQTNSVILNNCIGRLGMFMFWQINVTRPLSSACKSYLVCSDAGTGGPVVIGGDNLPSPVGIGLTDLQNIGEGGASGPPAPPPQFRHHFYSLSSVHSIQTVCVHMDLNQALWLWCLFGLVQL